MYPAVDRRSDGRQCLVCSRDVCGYTRSVGVAEDRSRSAMEGSQMPCLGEDVLRSGLTSAGHCDQGDGR